MLLKEIIRYVRDRTGENNTTALIAEINGAWEKLWYQTDPEGCLFEIDIIPTTERVMCLPWFVYQVKGVKRCHGALQSLYTPRPFYHEYNYKQSSFEWRFMHATPLLAPIMNAGQLTIKPRRVLSTPITVTVKGPGEFGVTEWEDISLGANEKSAQTAAVYNDVTALSKSALTDTDIEIRDITNTVIAVIPSDRLDVWNQLVKIIDKCGSTENSDGLAYTILYKAHPTVFTRDTDAIPGDYGLILQNVVSADLIAKSKDATDQKRAQRHDGVSGGLIANVSRKHGEGKLHPVQLSPSPFVHEYDGCL